MKVVVHLKATGRESHTHTATFTLLGIHSTKSSRFLALDASICSSTFMDIRPEHYGHRQERPWQVAGSHHVLGIKHLLLGSSGTVRGPVLLAAPGCGAKPGVKVPTGEGHRVDGSLRRSA